MLGPLGTVHYITDEVRAANRHIAEYDEQLYL